jgi:hypothetical protein
MKLATFDEGRVGRSDGDVLIELSCGSASGRPRRQGARMASGSCRWTSDCVPIVLKKFFHGRELHRPSQGALPSTGRIRFLGIVLFQNVDAIVGPGGAIVSGRITKSSTTTRGSIIVGKGGKWFAGGGGRAHWRLHGVNDITATSSARWSPAKAAEGNRDVLPDRPLHRHG